MTVSEILAGGTGTRMGEAIPKQFLNVGERSILVRTIDAFINSGLIDCYVICVPKAHLEQTRDIVNGAFHAPERFHFVAGGVSRNDSVYNGCKYIHDNLPVSDDDVVLTHDAVRPFIDDRIIAGNIELARRYGAVSTVIPCVDTILESRDGVFLSGVPERSALYRVQTPQSFRFSVLWKVFSSSYPEELARHTDVAGLAAAHGFKVALFRGDERNLKITTPFDLLVAGAVCEDNQPV